MQMVICSRGVCQIVRAFQFYREHRQRSEMFRNVAAHTVVGTRSTLLAIMIDLNAARDFLFCHDRQAIHRTLEFHVMLFMSTIRAFDLRVLHVWKQIFELLLPGGIRA